LKNLKRIVLRISLVFLITIPIAAFAHFIIFPQESRCILIDYTGFKRDGTLYFKPNTPQNKIDTLKSLINTASFRVKEFWGQKKCNPKFIYCDNLKDFKKYGSPYLVPAVTHLKLGSYIVISNEGVNLDIIAHEMTHTEFYERIGFYNWSFKIPKWFDEGLAMQNDYRDYYSEDTLKVRSGNYINLPGVKNFKKDNQFNDGSREQIMLNYMEAKHVVKHWYSKKKLQKLIVDLNSGKGFRESFKE
jgi:hypothetical protein